MQQTMIHMKILTKSLFITLLTIALFACGKNEGKIPGIQFKTDGGYIYESTEINPNTSFQIGLTCFKTQKAALTKFTISKTIDQSSSTEILSKTLKRKDKDTYSYNMIGTSGSVSGQKEKYIFTITDKYGLKNEVYLTLTVK